MRLQKTQKTQINKTKEQTTTTKTILHCDKLFTRIFTGLGFLFCFVLCVLGFVCLFVCLFVFEKLENDVSGNNLHFSNGSIKQYKERKVLPNSHQSLL